MVNETIRVPYSCAVRMCWANSTGFRTQAGLIAHYQTEVDSPYSTPQNREAHRVYLQQLRRSRGRNLDAGFRNVT